MTLSVQQYIDRMSFNLAKEIADDGVIQFSTRVRIHAWITTDPDPEADRYAVVEAFSSSQARWGETIYRRYIRKPRVPLHPEGCDILGQWWCCDHETWFASETRAYF